MPSIRDSITTSAQAIGDRFEAELLLAHLLDKPRSWLVAHGEDELSDLHAGQFAQLIKRRVTGEPVAYLIGRRGFWTLDLEVTNATLIPRPETELLVELALARVPAHESVRLLDLGTGSGAIALALARERSIANIIATDASRDALDVAQRNAQRYRIGNVSFLHGDWFEPLADQCFDIIVSNPPYIESDDPHLGQGDLRYEPTSALASGVDGLDDIRRIVCGAPSHLTKNGWLMLEHGWNQGDAVRVLFEREAFADVVTVQDLELRDRVTCGRYVGP